MQHPSNTPDAAGRGRSKWLAGVAVASALAGLVAVAPAAFAQPDDGAPAHRMEHGDRHGPGHMDKHMERMVDRVFTKVGATSEQKARAQVILKSAAEEMKQFRPEPGKGRAEMLALLSADTIDRDALEQLRAQRHAHMEQASRVMTKTMADLAEVLTPEQRREAAKSLARMGEGRHGGKHGRHHQHHGDAPKG
jgi:periplasmic protein CpxP/Spy